MKKSFALLMIILFAVSCGTSTKIVGTWVKQPEKDYNYKKIVVVGIARQEAVRKVFEEAITGKMQQEGYAAVGALDILPPTANKDNTTADVAISFFKSANADAVMTISLMSMKDTREYVPGRTYYQPYYYNYSFYDVYNNYYNYGYQPGYYKGNVEVFLEADLFDFKTGEMIWSAQTKSETMNLDALNKMADNYAKVLVNNLKKSKVLIPSGK